MKKATCLFLGILSLPVFLLFSAPESLAEQLAGVHPVIFSRISSNFGMRNHPIFKVLRSHAGVDLAAPMSAHVRVILKGKVIYAGENGGYGKLISVMHSDGLVTMYGHLDEILVNLGETVDGGHVIGRVGETGNVTGPHLHFEVRKKGIALNPLEFLPGLTAKPVG